MHLSPALSPLLRRAERVKSRRYLLAWVILSGNILTIALARWFSLVRFTEPFWKSTAVGGFLFLAETLNLFFKL